MTSRSATRDAVVERVAVFALSAAALLFQFAQTRLFSATLGYHLSFLVVSGCPARRRPRRRSGRAR